MTIRRKHLIIAFALTFILLILTAIAAHDAHAGEAGPEEYDVTERYCRPEPQLTMPNGVPQPWFPKPSPNMLQRIPPPGLGEGGAASPKLVAFVTLTRVYGEIQAKRVKRDGWVLLTRRMIYCSNLFAHDEHNARMQWHVLTVKFSDDGNPNNDLQREDWTHCRLVQARFPNVANPGSAKCSLKFRTVITRLGT